MTAPAPTAIGAATRQALRYVKLPASDPDLSAFPDFLIVGPQRTGTTWLHAHLRYHPQIMLAEPKELFFFSSLQVPGGGRFGTAELTAYLRCFREPLWRVLLHQAISLWRFHAPYRPRVRGEATASYAALDPDVIREITLLKPDIKVVLMIREPIARAWSHAKKDLARNRGRKLADVAPAEVEAFLADPYQRRCAQYVENVDNWAAHLQPRHLLVGLFDDIATRPEALLLAVMAFLGVDGDRRYISRAVREAVNPTGGERVPERYRRVLESLLHEDIERLRERFGLSWVPGPAGMRLERAPGRRAADGRVVFALDDV